MKKFFKDYKDLSLHSIAFWKEHWIGMTISTIASYGLVLGVIYLIDYIQLKRYNEKLEKELDEKAKEAGLNY